MSPKIIKINRPFYFSIQSQCMKKSGKVSNCPINDIPIFTGRLVDPSI